VAAGSDRAERADELRLDARGQIYLVATPREVSERLLRGGYRGALCGQRWPARRALKLTAKMRLVEVDVDLTKSRKYGCTTIHTEPK
jgi:hypothetical protein